MRCQLHGWWLPYLLFSFRGYNFFFFFKWIFKRMRWYTVILHNNKIKIMIIHAPVEAINYVEGIFILLNLMLIVMHSFYQESHQYWMSHEFYYACALMFLFSVSHIVVVSTQYITGTCWCKDMNFNYFWVARKKKKITNECSKWVMKLS